MNDLQVELWVGADGADPDWLSMGTFEDPGRLHPDPITIVTGRQDESTQSEPEPVELVLDNSDGYLTPDSLNSALWPTWGQNTPVRIRDGDDTLFWGEASEITPEWPHGDQANPGPGIAQLKVAATGILRRLTQGQRALRSALYRRITRAAGVQAYWPCEDGIDADTATSGLPGPAPSGPSMAMGGFSWAADSTVLGSQALPTAGEHATWRGQVNDYLDEGISADWVVEEVLSVPVAPDANTALGTVLDVSIGGSTIVRWRVDVLFANGQPNLRLVGSDSAGNAAVDRSAPSPPGFFDAPLILRLERSAPDYLLSWERDVNDSASLAAGTHASEPGWITSVGGQVAGLGVTIGHIVISSQPTSWLDDAFAGHLGEPAGQRAIRLCDEENTALTIVGDPATTTPMGAQRADATFLAALQECEQTDIGILTEDQDSPGLRYLCRRARYNQPPALILDAGLSHIAGLTPTRDDLGLANDITVERVGGGSATKIDPVDSQPRPVGRGRYDITVPLSLAWDRLLDDQAGWRLHTGTWKGMRSPQIIVDLGVAPELRAQINALRPGDRIQITNTPPQLGVDLDLIFEGATHEIDLDTRTVILNCSPAGIWTVARWGISRWGLKDHTLADAVDEHATTLQISFIGHKITTRPEQYPFDLRLGGSEVVTITTVTGLTSPQTATVIRGVNSLARAHPAGTRVELAEQPILAL